MQKAENLQNELRALLDAHHEWLVIDAAGRSLALVRAEIEIACDGRRLLLGLPGEKGWRTWRVLELKTKASEILLHLTRNFERERARLRLVPRVSAKDLSASVELARLEKANRLAALIAAQFRETRLVSVRLNKNNGRLAQIVFEDPGERRRTAAVSDVSERLTPEFLLSSAVLWLVRLAARKRAPVRTIWIVAEKTPAKKLRKLHALLRPGWQSKILIKEISAAAPADGEPLIGELPALGIAGLWRAAPGALKPSETPELSAAARRIIELAPAEIDAVFSRRGETLRFNGLPFARVRKMLDRESVWFGVEKTRLPLAEETLGEFAALLENLREFRAADSPNKRHAFYRHAPEAWLEAVLRRNIRLLDANLILSPLHQQFRAERGRVDLLALRRDGRLVIIELKTGADREMVFQIAGYWRRIELFRRRGLLEKARLFGALEIADKPAICYAVAPRLAFHRDFELLAGTVSEEIEIHRFNLAENWRARLKVTDRREAVAKVRV